MARHVHSQPIRLLIAEVGFALGLILAGGIAAQPPSRISARTIQQAVCDNDQVCEPGEQTIICGDCPSVCGDQICAPIEVNTCAADCPLQLTCGDRMCSTFETFSTCPLDCDPPTRTPPGSTPLTASPLATSTRLPASTATPVSTATFTPPPTATAAVDREATAAAESTDTPSPTATQPAPSPEAGIPEPPANCRLVEVSEVDQDVVQAYVAQTRGYTAQNWMICERAPSEVCLPADRVLESVVEGYNDLSLLDCTEDDCEVIGAATQQEGQECYTIALAPGGPGCTQGCAFARLPASPPGFRMDWVSALLIFLVAVMLGLFITLLVSRQRAAGEEIIEIPTPRGS